MFLHVFNVLDQFISVCLSVMRKYINLDCILWGERREWNLSVKLRACNLMVKISFVIFEKLSYLVSRGEIKHDDYGMSANEGEFPVATTITQLIVPNRTITHQFPRCLCIFLPQRPTFGPFLFFLSSRTFSGKHISYFRRPNLDLW